MPTMIIMRITIEMMMMMMMMMRRRRRRRRTTTTTTTTTCASLDIVLSATVQPSLRKMMQTLCSLRCGCIAAGEQNAKRWLLLLFWQTKNFCEETWLLWLSSLRIYGTIWQPKSTATVSVALLCLEFLRSVTITERAYAGPDYTSGQTLSTTVGIEHEKDSRLLEIGMLTQQC